MLNRQILEAIKADAISCSNEECHQHRCNKGKQYIFHVLQTTKSYMLLPKDSKGGYFAKKEIVG